MTSYQNTTRKPVQGRVRLEMDTVAHVSVGEESTSQVSLVGTRGPLVARACALVNRDLEVHSEFLYLPKNCKVTVELVGDESAASADTGLRLQCEVRKVQMLSPAPLYRLWIQLSRADADAVRRWLATAETEATAPAGGER